MGHAAAQRCLAAEDFVIGDWLVQPSAGVVVRLTTSKHLEPKTMEVLVCLAAHRGHVVSKDELLRTVWQETFVTEHVLTHAVWQLRQTLGNELIETIPRRGYRLTAPVRRWGRTQHLPAIAVLPLLNLCGDPEQEYFADGMTEALISAVAQIGGLRVISRTSAMQYKSSAKPLQQIGTELNVDYVVEGSVIRAGERVRTTVQLIHAPTDEHVWAKAYDRNLRDVLELQDEVARTIASQIQVTLTPAEHKRLTRVRSINPVAQEFYLKGRYCYLQLTADAMRMGIEYHQQAIAADPGFALAYAGLADPLAMLASPVASAVPPSEALPQAFAAVDRALELDPDLPEANRELGWKKLHCELDWTGAEQAIQYALTLNPSYGDGYQSLAELYSAVGRHDEAIAALHEACKLDPLSLNSQSMLGLILMLAGQTEQAIEQLQKTISLDPRYQLSSVLLSLALADAGRYGEAVTAAETAVGICPVPLPQAILAYVYGRSGNTGQARVILAGLREFAKTHYLSPLVSAVAFIAVGELESALDCLETSCAIRESYGCPFLRSFPVWRPLHGHPRFQELVRRVKFPD